MPISHFANRISGIRRQWFVKPTSPPDVRAEIHELITAGQVTQARRTAEAAIRRFPDDVNLTDLAIACAAFAGDADRGLELAVANAHRRIAQLQDFPEAQRPTRQLDPQSRIFVCGYFYSGSGAVLDFLNDHARTRIWTPKGEMRWIKSADGIGDLADRHAAEGRLTASDLVGFYLHIVGRTITLTPEGVYHIKEKVNQLGRKLLQNPAAHGYLRSCLECFTSLVNMNEEGLSGPALENHFRDSVKNALDAAATGTGADVLLIDQAITAWRLRLARFAPPSTFVLVHRDPRDQFAEVRRVKQQPGRNPTFAEKFARTYRKRRRRAENAYPMMTRQHGHRVIHVSFDDFVLNHERVREEVREFVGFDVGSYRQDRFDPAVSRKNIGKHIDMTSTAEIDVLAEQLPEYMHRQLETSTFA